VGVDEAIELRRGRLQCIRVGSSGRCGSEQTCVEEGMFDLRRDTGEFELTGKRAGDTDFF
jgi:hypothetical protein